ncbi:MAG: hypothetical protein IKS31_10775 [Clostridia bacterium]|nr:hypothetical protein [Clostridia bacterium]MBR4459428.1 hypothetical protein [Clostridia bacterium]
MRTETFIRLNRVETPDGMGGQTVTWEDGEAVQLFPIPARTIREDEAGRPAMKTVMLLFGSEGLPFAGRVRRVKDGTVMRILSDGNWETPEGSLWHIFEMQAEVVGP